MISCAIKKLDLKLFSRLDIHAFRPKSSKFEQKITFLLTLKFIKLNETEALKRFLLKKLSSEESIELDVRK